MMDEIREDEQNVLYKTKVVGDGAGEIDFSPGLPHDGLMEEILNNKQIVTASPHVVQKILNMEWKWFERRIIKWLGDTPKARHLQEQIRNHMKNEKKWIQAGAKAEKAKDYQG